MPERSRKKNTSIILLIIVGILVFLSGFFIGRIDLVNRQKAGLFLNGDVKGEKDGVNVNLLWEVWDKIDAIYIKDDLEGEKLLDGMVNGLVDSLDDPYTAYLTAEETKEYLSSNAGKFEGIGTTLRYTGEYTEIETPIDGYPAQEAGLRSGDKIIEVDGTEVKGKREYEVADLIRGEAGTIVKIKIVRTTGTEDEELDFEISRKKIDIDSITLEMIDENTALIKINQFTEDSVSSFNGEWDKIANQVSQKGADKIIIDLRNNPGGYVDCSVHVLEEFFPKNTHVMSERNKDGKVTKTYTQRDGKFRDQKVVILMNEGSASASEIFAGAMQDNDRAIVIGKKSVGKGVEQQIITLGNGGSLHIVFQEWMLPSGRVINKDDSITPNIEVDLTEEDFRARRDPQLQKAKDEIVKQ